MINDYDFKKKLDKLIIKYKTYGLNDEQLKLLLKKIVNYLNYFNKNDQVSFDDIEMISQEFLSNIITANNLELLIKTYIDDILNVGNSKFENIHQLEKFCKYVKKIQLSDEILNRLLETNNKLTDILKQVVDSYLDEIKKYNFTKIYTNDEVISLIKDYCFIKGIITHEMEDSHSYSTSGDYFENNCLKQYLKEMDVYPLLTTDEEKELLIKIFQGDEDAREFFINCNLRLVISIARKYLGLGISLDDLIQDGNLGLIKAVEKFDLNRGTKFSTYATNWIQQFIRNGIINKGRTIRVPIHSTYKLNKIKKYIFDCKLIGYRPSLEELSEIFSISTNRLKLLLQADENVISINDYVNSNEENASTMEMFFKSDECIEEDVEEQIMREEVRNAIDKCNLNENQRIVIVLRYGLEDDNPRTLDEVGKLLNVTKERVRQIENEALRIMRRSGAFSKLKNYVK